MIFMQLSGVSGTGKTTLLKDLADQLGFTFESFDSLTHFSIPSIKKLLTETVPEHSNIAGVIIELTNIDKYRMLIDQFSQGGNSKSKKDLTEMRFVQTFQ